MRTLLAFASLTCIWGLCGSLGAQPQDAPLPRERWQKPIIGRGETVETAKKDAYRQAKEVVDFLRSQQKPLVQASDLSEETVRRHFLVNDGEADDDVKIELKPGEEQAFKQWSVTLRPETERLLRADERQTISSFGMIGLSIFLITGFGYIRLDEYTHRRYTAWLRLASLGAVVSALVGWWAVAR